MIQKLKTFLGYFLTADKLFLSQTFIAASYKSSTSLDEDVIIFNTDVQLFAH